MASVQFMGRAALLEGVRDMLEVWGLFQTKQFIVAGEGIEQLNNFLKKLEPGGSGAAYTLRFYSKAGPEEIDEKTPYQGSLNFKLSNQSTIGAGSIDERLARIEEKLDGDEDDDEPEQTESIAGIILDYLKNPEKIATVLGAIKDLRAGRMPEVLQPGAVGAFDKPETDEQRVERLSRILDRLQRADPLIVDHLGKLADLAEQKPDLFKMLLKQLDNGL